MHLRLFPSLLGSGHETDFTIADFVSDLRAPTPTAAAELASPNQVDLRLAISELDDQLVQLLDAFLRELRWTLLDLQNQLERNSPISRIQSDIQRMDELEHRLGASIQYKLLLTRTHLSGLIQQVSALSPTAVLERGYAIVTNQAGQAISAVGQVSGGEALKVEVSDGVFGVHVDH